MSTPEIVKKFVTTANYLYTRHSKEPFVGGVSHVEYGWSDSVINAAILHIDNYFTSASIISGPGLSVQSSIKSSVNQGSFGARRPGDKMAISDWMHQQQSMMSKVLLEVDQNKAFTTCLQNIEDELQKYNELRGAMAFTVSFPSFFFFFFKFSFACIL